MQSFSIGKHWGLLLFVGTVAVATGIIAGIWPSYYSTSGQPAMILRGNYGLAAGGGFEEGEVLGVEERIDSSADPSLRSG